MHRWLIVVVRPLAMVVGVIANTLGVVSIALEWLDAADFPPLRVIVPVWLIGTGALVVVIATYVVELVEIRRRP